MRYKMLVSDIDGTLLNAKGQLTEGVIAAIREAHRQGVIVTLATGRHLRGVREIVQQIDVSVPVILANGAVIVDPLKGETLLHRPLDRETASAILDVVKKHDLWASLFLHAESGIDTYYDRDPGFEEAYLFIHRDPAVSKQVENLQDYVHLDPLKVLLLDKPEKVWKLAEDLKALDRDFSIVVSDHDFPGYTFLECFDPASSKATGIAHLADLLHLKQEEIVAVGDNVNDFEMLDYAGLGVAMGNAAQAVKERADWITKTNDEDGLAFLIKEKILS